MKQVDRQNRKWNQKQNQEQSKNHRQDEEFIAKALVIAAKNANSQVSLNNGKVFLGEEDGKAEKMNQEQQRRATEQQFLVRDKKINLSVYKFDPFPSSSLLPFSCLRSLIKRTFYYVQN